MKATMMQAKKKIGQLLRKTKNIKNMTKEQKAARKAANEALFLMGITPANKREEIEGDITGAAEALKKAFEKKEK